MPAITLGFCATLPRVFLAPQSSELPEDVARLSPLVYEHINLLGRYAFSVPEAVQRGQLRPLRTSSEAIEELS